MHHFQVMFSGEIVEGAREAQVRLNLARKFGLDERKVGQLFSGRTVVIESGMSAEAASSLQKELSDLGAVARVKDLTPDGQREVKVDSRDYKADAPHADYTLNDITAAHVECPRCGHMQLDAQACARCGIDIGSANQRKRQENQQIEREIHGLKQDHQPHKANVSRGSPRRPSVLRAEREAHRKTAKRGWLSRLFSRRA